MDTNNNWPEEAIDRILSLTTENARLKSEIKDLERKLRDIQLTLELSAENSGNWII